MEVNKDYPFVFRTGRHKGESLESVFLNDPMYVSRAIKNAFSKQKNPKKPVTNHLQLAVEELQSRLCKLKVERICPVCKEEKVQMFLLPDFGKIDEKLVCCFQKSCHLELLSKRAGNFYAINDFLLFIAYMDKKKAKKIINIFNKTYTFESLEQIA